MIRLKPLMACPTNMLPDSKSKMEGNSPTFQDVWDRFSDKVQLPRSRTCSGKAGNLYSSILRVLVSVFLQMSYSNKH